MTVIDLKDRRPPQRTDRNTDEEGERLLRASFVQVQMSLLMRKHQPKVASTWVVAHYLLWKHWRKNGCPFTVTTTALQRLGVSRWQKARALGELEAIDWASFEYRPRKNPICTSLRMDQRKRC